jgi:hypothetical protein
MPSTGSVGEGAIPGSQIPEAAEAAVAGDGNGIGRADDHEKNEPTLDTPNAPMKEERDNSGHQQSRHLVNETTEIHRHTMEAALQTFQSLFFLPIRSARIWQDVWFGAGRLGR